MADNYANLNALQRFWQKAKDYIDTALGLKLDADAYATDSAYGIVKTNPGKSITLNASGQLEVGGRLGQFPDGFPGVAAVWAGCQIKDLNAFHGDQ